MIKIDIMTELITLFLILAGVFAVGLYRARVRVRRLEDAMLYHIGVTVVQLLQERDYFDAHPEERERLIQQAEAEGEEKVE